MTAQTDLSFAVLGPKGDPIPPRTTNCHGTQTDGSQEQPTAMVPKPMVPWSAVRSFLKSAVSPNLEVRPFLKNAVSPNLGVWPFLKGQLFVLMGAGRAHDCTNWPLICRAGAQIIS